MVNNSMAKDKIKKNQLKKKNKSTQVNSTNLLSEI
jgi:hypothetical protein